MQGRRLSGELTSSDSPPRHVIGIGASAGGLDALLKVLGPLPAGFAHPVCVVLHLAPSGRSLLPQILDRRCALTAVPAEHGTVLEGGHVYVAQPDRHLMVRDGRIVLSQEPRESGSRPAVDAMLRSLASASRAAAVAVVLSGALGDGGRGARLVADAGGLVFVQDPAEAIVPSMPQRTLAAVGPAARVMPAAVIGAALAALDPALEALPR